MSIINVEHISKLYGDKMILDDISCSVDYGDKIGIIGVNGTGKSTLLRIIAGHEEADEGEIIFSRGLTVGWLPQDPDFPEEGTVLSYVTGRTGPARAEGPDSPDNPDSPDDPDTRSALLFDVSDPIDYGLESEAKTILQALELPDYDMQVSKLSGGQRKRAALCRVLLKKSDVLVLDEPTNHLDNPMADWLERFLIQYRGVLLLVTHDRYFLDRVTNHIWEIDKGSIYFYDANYSGFLELKAEREEMALAAERKRQSILRVERQWVMRGARARSTKQKARLERYEQLMRLDSPKSAGSVEIEAVGARLGKKTIEVENISKGFGEKQLFTEFSYVFPRYARIAFVGANGCGKSTLMNILAGRLEPDAGSIAWGDTIRIGYFTQNCEVMDERLRVIDYIKDQAEYIPTTTGVITASRMLERFLFSPDMQYAPISKISGGERRRLYLLKVLMSSPNVLILDEPTNDLDIDTLQVLESFLDTFLGIVIIVSHDRYFLDRVADRIFAFEDGKIRMYEGGYTDYLEKRSCRGLLEEQIDTVYSGSVIHKKKSGTDDFSAGNDSKRAKRRLRPEKLRFTYNEKREFETIDDEIAALEDKLSRLDQEIAENARDFVKLGELMKEKDETETLLEEKTERWVYLNDLAERIEAQKDRG